MSGALHKLAIGGGVVALIGVMSAVTPAKAAGPELSDPRFVPNGYAYAPGRTTPPNANSRQGEIEAQADIRETEIYNEQRRQERFERFFRSFRELDINSPNESYRY